jgi:predicted nucleic acid-binding protein
VSAIAIYELWYGVEKSEQREANTGRVHTFLAGPITLAPFTEDDAKAAGNVANTKEFSRIKELVWEDWAKL